MPTPFVLLNLSAQAHKEFNNILLKSFIDINKALLLIII